jgi:hypothetical protein
LLSHIRVVNNDGRIETSYGDLVCERSSFRTGDAAGEMIATTLGAMLTQEFLESKRSDRGDITESEKLLKKITHMLSLSNLSDGELIITNVSDIDGFKNNYMCTLWSKYLEWDSYVYVPESRKKRSSKPILLRFKILNDKLPIDLIPIQLTNRKVIGDILECDIDCDERDVWNLVHEILSRPVMEDMFIDKILSYSDNTLHVTFDSKKFNYLKIRALVPTVHAIYWNNISRLIKVVPDRKFVRDSLTIFFNAYYTGSRNAEYIQILINTIIPLSGSSFSGCGYHKTKRQNVTNYMTMCLFESIRQSMIRMISHGNSPFVDSTLYTDLLCGWMRGDEKKNEDEMVVINDDGDGEAMEKEEDLDDGEFDDNNNHEVQEEEESMMIDIDFEFTV